MNVPSGEEVYSKAKHVHCVMCDTTMDTGGLTFGSADDVDQAYDVLFCCSDPFYEAVIISKDPLFPEDDKDAPTNSEFWHYGKDQYEYNVSALLDMYEEEAKS